MRDAAQFRDFAYEAAGTISLIRVADNLAAAQAELSEADFDMIILEITLPDSHGLRSVNILRTLAPAAPIFVVSHDLSRDLTTLIMRKGVQACYNKMEINQKLVIEIIGAARAGTRAKVRPVHYGPSILDQKRALDLMCLYLAPEVRARALRAVRNGTENIEAEEMDLTIMFADIVGFTEMSEERPLRDVVVLLNETWEVVTTTITMMDGYVDKYMGDAVMAVFEDAQSAVHAGLEIQSLFLQINQFRALSEMAPINVRIGINSGRVIRGEIGTVKRRDWTVVGDVVNTTSRIQRYANAGEVVIGDSTYERLKDRLDILRDETLNFRGKKRSTTVHCVTGIRLIMDGKERFLSISPIVED